MSRSFFCAVLGLVLLAGGAAAFEAVGKIKKVDADKNTVFLFAGGMDRTVKVDPAAKILDAQGKDLSGGLKSKDLKEGAEVTLTIEREGSAPVIKVLRLGRRLPPPPDKVDTSSLLPLTDMGVKEYHGFKGGLYPDGKNERPTGHEAAGMALARQVKPLDADGKPSANGKIVLMGVGMSNTNQSFSGFMNVAKSDKEINPWSVVLVNGAQGGMTAFRIQNLDDKTGGAQYWRVVDQKLQEAGATRAQVQAVWIKQADAGPNQGFPKYAQTLQAELTRIVQLLHTRFPNLKLVYLSSRTYGGWAKTRLNPEPYAFESGLSVKWLIEQQLKGDPELNYDPAKGPVKAPWLSWGPYLWANGTTKRSDGFSYDESDFQEGDRTHQSPAGQRKVGKELLRFFKNDTTTRGWFRGQ